MHYSKIVYSLIMFQDGRDLSFPTLLCWTRQTPRQKIKLSDTKTRDVLQSR